ncbi:hypothetical protein NC651_032093 [Populus alba x Populus x berolinensis]|nr:hypothetical protein NC651_032093 [Populus alba x Populus x berolinensis]
MATGKPVLLSDLVSIASYVPSNYIRPVSDRPKLSEVLPSDGSIPLIDLQGLEGPNRSSIVGEIGQACQTHGFFQVKNHGIPDKVIDGTLRVSKESFHLTERERLKNYSDDPMKTTRLSTSFNVKTEIIPYTFIVNIGDQIQVISNDRYRSVLHRAVVDRDKERISIPTFYCPSADAVIGPAPSLIDDDHPALYRNFAYSERYQIEVLEPWACN